MARFVLVHGAWHGAWCFDELVDELDRRGHQALAVDLPCDEVGLTQLDYAAHVGAHPDAVVVGHSFGAQTIPHVPARTRVYLGGVLPVPNVYEHAFAAGFGGTVRDELGRSYWPDPDVCATKLYPDCPRARSDWAYPQLRRQAPIQTIAAPLGGDDVVIATMCDTVIEPGWQVRVAEAHGARLVQLDAGHSPFFTQPDELAHVLSTVA